MATEIIEERLRELANIHLGVGNHDGPDDGMCVMEAVSWIAGEKWSDAPKCVSPVLARLMIRLNDRLPDAERQQLKEFAKKVVGTRGTAKVEEQRGWMAADWAIRECAPRWLDLHPGLVKHAAKLRALAPIVGRDTWDAARPLVAAARDAAYGVRAKERSGLIVRLKAELTTRGITAAAVGDAAADAAAYAYAAVVAAGDADAAAAADAYAVADAAADAVGDAAADAAADAAEVAVAAAYAYAAAVAAGDAYADAYADADRWDAVYRAARAKLTEVYRERFAPTIEASRESIFGLIERMIAYG